MLDVSAHGAWLELEAAAKLPNTFMQLLSHDGGFRRQCSVIWRSENAGYRIQFTIPNRAKATVTSEFGGV